MYLKQSLLAVAVSIEYVSAAQATGGAVYSGQAYPVSFINTSPVTATGDGSIGLHLLDNSYGKNVSTPAEADQYPGDIINRATVKASGVDASAMTIEATYRRYEKRYTAGIFINDSNGVIEATGEGSTGLHPSGATLNGGVQNDGRISGGGVGLNLDSTAKGIGGFTSTIRDVDNAGVMKASALTASAAPGFS